MNKLSMLKRLILCAICVALCYVLPLAFHAFGAGTVFLPMHIPVLLCGLICGWPYGLLCGLVGPVLSSLLSGMPPAAVLPGMILELAVYGAVTGICMRMIRTKHLYADLYLSLLIAIVCGRIAAGIAQALIFTGGGYTFRLWINAYLLTSLPGTAIQLILIPTLVFALMKAHLIPERYPK